MRSCIPHKQNVKHKHVQRLNTDRTLVTELTTVLSKMYSVLCAYAKCVVYEWIPISWLSIPEKAYSLRSVGEATLASSHTTHKL